MKKISDLIEQFQLTQYHLWREIWIRDIPTSCRWFYDGKDEFRKNIKTIESVYLVTDSLKQTPKNNLGNTILITRTDSLSFAFFDHPHHLTIWTILLFFWWKWRSMLWSHIFVQWYDMSKNLHFCLILSLNQPSRIS